MKKLLLKLTVLILSISVLMSFNCATAFAEDANSNTSAICSVLGHLNDVQITKATFKKKGTIKYTCLRCGNVSTESIAKPVLKCSPNQLECTGLTVIPGITGLDRIYYSAVYPEKSKLPGSYSIKVNLRGLYYTGSKTINYKIVLKKPSIQLQQEEGKRNVIISGYQVPGAEKYTIFHYMKKNKKWECVDKITVKNTESYKKNVKLKKNSQHRYKVKAIAKNKDFTATSKYMIIKIK